MREEIKDRIIERVDPEELIDMLNLDIEYLVARLDIEINEAIEVGTFDYLKLEDEE